MVPDGQVITFYSYKGGAGRTFLVASVAATLASWGKKVICLDWDLEAPGLGLYFKPYISHISGGLLDLTEGLTLNPEVSWRDHVTQVELPNRAKMDFIATGSERNYTDRLQALQWDHLFDSHKFGDYLESMRRDLKNEYEFAIIDSRTGISDIGGICAVQLPDVLVMVVTTSDQSINGTAEIASRIPTARDQLAFDRLALPIVPILSRFDAREERKLGNYWLARTVERLASLYKPWLPPGHEVIDILERTTIPYVSSWNFGERIPLLEERSSSPESVSWAIDNLAALLINGLTEVTGLVSDRDPFVRRARTQAASNARSYDIYISAADRDAEKMQELATTLSDNGFLVSTSDVIPSGAEWADQVEVSLRASSHLVLMIDEKLARPQQTELEIFLAETINRDIESRVVLVLTSGQLNMPSRGLNQYQQVGWTSAPRVAVQIEFALSLRWRGDVAQWSATLAERENSFGPNHPAVVATRMNLAEAYREAGRPDEAITLYQRTLTSQMHVLGSHSPAVLAIQRSLAEAYVEAGRVAEGILLLERTLDDFEAILGSADPDTITCRSRLAYAYLEAGRLDEAISLFESTLAEREQILGPTHPDTLSSRGNLASAYQAAGRLDEAISLFESTLAEREQILGPTHPDTLSSRGDLAYGYREAGRLDEAIPLFEQTLEDFEQILGLTHPDTLTSRNDLAGAYRAIGRVTDAIPLYERTLADREQFQGDTHPDVLTSRNNLALAYQEAERTSEAIPLFERTLVDFERILGAAAPNTLTSRNNLARAYQAAGRVAEAIPLFERTLADREQILGAAAPDTLTSRNNLARAYQAAGRMTEVIPLLERILADREQILGATHPDALAARNNLALAYQAAGRVAEAIPLFERTLVDRERVLGDAHPDTLASRSSLANAQREVGRS